MTLSKTLLAALSDDELCEMASAANAELYRRAKREIVRAVLTVRPDLPQGTLISFGTDLWDNGYFYSARECTITLPDDQAQYRVFTDEEHDLFQRLTSTPLATLSVTAGERSSLDIPVTKRDKEQQR